MTSTASGVFYEVWWPRSAARSKATCRLSTMTTADLLNCGDGVGLKEKNHRRFEKDISKNKDVVPLYLEKFQLRTNTVLTLYSQFVGVDFKSGISFALNDVPEAQNSCTVRQNNGRNGLRKRPMA